MPRATCDPRPAPLTHVRRVHGLLPQHPEAHGLGGRTHVIKGDLNGQLRALGWWEGWYDGVWERVSGTACGVLCAERSDPLNSLQDVTVAGSYSSSYTLNATCPSSGVWYFATAHPPRPRPLCQDLKPSHLPVGPVFTGLSS